jgi:hypothetical protein
VTKQTLGLVVGRQADANSDTLQFAGTGSEQRAQLPLTPEQFAGLEKMLLTDVSEMRNDLRWDGKASCRQPALIAAGRIKSCCPRVFPSGAAATNRYINFALI